MLGSRVIYERKCDLSLLIHIFELCCLQVIFHYNFSYLSSFSICVETQCIHEYYLLILQPHQSSPCFGFSTTPNLKYCKSNKPLFSSQKVHDFSRAIKMICDTMKKILTICAKFYSSCVSTVDPRKVRKLGIQLL